jgi:hypothetical protein
MLLIFGTGIGYCQKNRVQTYIAKVLTIKSTIGIRFILFFAIGSCLGLEHTTSGMMITIQSD